MYENNRYFSHVTSAYYLDLKNTGMGHVIQLELCESSVDFYFYFFYLCTEKITQKIYYMHIEIDYPQKENISSSYPRCEKGEGKSGKDLIRTTCGSRPILCGSLDWMECRSYSIVASRIVVSRVTVDELFSSTIMSLYYSHCATLTFSLINALMHQNSTIEDTL